MLTATAYISFYGLQPHPEGGWYKETYKSTETIDGAYLPQRFTGGRAIATAIYFLLEHHNFSAFHKIKSDECWHFYAGDALEIFVLLANGALQTITLGNDIANGQQFQYVVPANCWFASRPAAGSRYCFTGCTVAPGFDFEDFELAEVTMLCNQYPQHAALITTLCR
jgi:uncharacterized protein